MLYNREKTGHRLRASSYNPNQILQRSASTKRRRRFEKAACRAPARHAAFRYCAATAPAYGRRHMSSNRDLAAPPDTFARRHLGSDPADDGRNAPAFLASRRSKRWRTPRSRAQIRLPRPLHLPGGVRRKRRARRAARDRRPEPGLPQLHRHGLLRHAHPGCHPAQHPRKPGLVHRLHALPGGDLPGPARGAAQFPDDDLRSHRAGDRQRLHARRGHRRRRGHDALPPPQGGRRRTCFFVSGRLPSADHRRRPHARQAARHRGRGRRPPHLRARRPVSRRPRAVPRHLGRHPRLRRLLRAGPCRRRALRRRRRPARADAAAPPGRIRRRRRRGFRPSASACRWASAARMRLSSPRATPSSARCPAASSACPRMRRATPPCASRWAPANSTSAARRPRPTSAPRRCCWPSWPRCTRCTTARRACAASRGACVR